jgi:hypothetical protein
MSVKSIGRHSQLKAFRPEGIRTVSFKEGIRTDFWGQGIPTEIQKIRFELLDQFRLFDKNRPIHLSFPERLLNRNTQQKLI